MNKRIKKKIAKRTESKNINLMSRSMLSQMGLDGLSEKTKKSMASFLAEGISLAIKNNQ